MSRGIKRERMVARLLLADGWWIVRAAGSLGDADIVALKAGFPPRLVEVKSDRDNPYDHFGPAARAEIIVAARKAGAEAWLVWWPPRGQPKWIHENDWPPIRAAAA